MNKSRGLTLVEVLVAAVILFAALSLSALTIQSLRQNSAQAEKIVKTLQPARMITLSIQQQIRNRPEETMSGAGELGEVSYTWQASVISKGSAPQSFDVDTGSVIVPPERFWLYQVELELHYAGRTEQLQFKELAWLPLVF
ncbi:type II secretion system GspH family protein [Rheinheimera muenzenbergensis]|uniref:Type II secretion system GspH family protein n=1 Tax=Rheinheimera muenzenbergensis TaxID=1193628 RepID=A0ABU8C1V3_9GAMM